MKKTVLILLGVLLVVAIILSVIAHLKAKRESDVFKNCDINLKKQHECFNQLYTEYAKQYKCQTSDINECEKQIKNNLKNKCWKKFPDNCPVF
jgi:hypothetical protein